MGDRAVLFFNFGNSCALRLIICMYTLRKYYKGDAILLQQEKEQNTEKIKEISEKIGVQVELMNVERICKRNFKSVMAPKVLKISPYETSIQIDADTTFRDSPQQILDWCHDYGILVSHFNNWISSGRTMSGRIKSFSDVISVSDLYQSLNRRPAVNCGVVGYRHGMADDFQKEWDDLTNKTAGRFIAEEIACQCVYWKYPHYLAPPPWNTSVVWGSLEEAKIIHYHGSKHTSLNRRNSRYWWAEVGWAIQDNILTFDEFKYWGQYDENVVKIMDKNDVNKILKDATSEFADKRIFKEV